MFLLDNRTYFLTSDRQYIIYRSHGIVLSSTDPFDRGAPMTEKGDPIERKNIEDLFDKGVDYFNMDLYDRAIASFTEVLELDPDHPDALYYRAIARANNSDFNGAVSDFTKALEKDPYDTDSYIGRGQTWESMGRLKRALADFKKALHLDPDNADYQHLVDVLEKKSNETHPGS